MSSVYPPFGGPPAQRCLRCGAPLPPNVITCSNCGTYNPVTQPGWSSDQGQSQRGRSPAPSSYDGSRYSGQQWGQAPLAPPQNSQWGQPPAFPQNDSFGTPYTPQPVSSPNNIYGQPGQGQQSNFNNSYGMPQQNAYYSAPSALYEGYSPANLTGYAPAGYAQPPQKKRGPRVGLIVCFLLLVLILGGGAFAGYTYLKSHNQQSNATNATPTRVTTPAVTPLFSDQFGKNSKTGWDLSSKPGQYSVKVGDGSMVLEDDNNTLFWEVLPGKSFTDFRLDVDAALTQGDPNNGYGVIIRGASSQNGDLSTYYRFELYGDGSYAIFKGSLDATGHTQSKMVQSSAPTNPIAKAGHFNHITIIAKGPLMTLMVNGQTIYTYSDNNYISGSVALFVSNLPKLTPGTQATFTQLAIFSAS
jgi:hypothetical protein